jgi:protein TonB
MEVKKIAKADLEQHKTTFTLAGFVVTLAIILLAFEWTTYEKTQTDLGELTDIAPEEEVIPIVREQPPPPPPPPPPPQVIEELVIVEDDEVVEEEIEIDTEVEVEEEVEIVEVEEEEEPEEAPVFFIVEEMPKFPGGQGELQKYIAKSIKYPEIAKENNIQGRVYVNFVVNDKGEVEKVKVVRGVDPSLDKEAIRVIKSLPKWKPGKQRGKAVKVSMSLPINFKLRS